MALIGEPRTGSARCSRHPLGSTQQLLAVTISSEVNVLVLCIMLCCSWSAPQGHHRLLRPRYRLRAGGKHDK